MQEVFSGVGDAGVNLLDFGACLLPVAAVFNLAAHAALIARQALLVLLEAVERGDESAVAHRGKAGNTHVDADKNLQKTSAANMCSCAIRFVLLHLLCVRFGSNLHYSMYGLFFFINCYIFFKE